MKQAKIMLMAIAIFGVIGGALAFKASKFSTGSYYVCTTTAASPVTPICLTKITTVAAGSAATFVTKVYTSTSAQQGFCPNTTLAPTAFYCTGATISTKGYLNVGE